MLCCVVVWRTLSDVLMVSSVMLLLYSFHFIYVQFCINIYRYLNIKLLCPHVLPLVASESGYNRLVVFVSVTEFILIAQKTTVRFGAARGGAKGSRVSHWPTLITTNSRNTCKLEIIFDLFFTFCYLKGNENVLFRRGG